MEWNLRGGTLTGVKLPISMEKMSEIAQIADQTIEKVLTKAKEKTARVGIEQSGVGAGKGNIESMSISKKEV